MSKTYRERLQLDNAAATLDTSHLDKFAEVLERVEKAGIALVAASDLFGKQFYDWEKSADLAVKTKAAREALAALREWRDSPS